MALPNGIKSTEELLDAQAHVWNHIYNFINSMSLKCAIELGIPDIIHKHGKPMTLSELTDALPVNKAKSLWVERLMRILIHSKFFIRDENERYWLTPASSLVFRDEPMSVAPLALAVLSPTMTAPWHHVSEWFQNDHDPTPFVTAHGKNFFELAEQDSWLNECFNEAMASDARLVTSLIMKDCRHVFDGLSSIVDVGGGTGYVAKAFADEFPGMRCSVLELPYVIAGLEGTENLTFVEGDMFESIPPADAVFMKWILHNWSDEECVKILKNCKVAIPGQDKGGKVVIIDIVMENERDHETVETQLFFDMQMMIMAPGRQRAEKDWAKLFSDAGFTSYKITPVLGLRSLIQVFP